MIPSKLLKNCIPVHLLSGTIGRRMFDQLEAHASVDPIGSSWSSAGFIEVEPDEYVIDIDGAGKLCAVQFNERILPGKVRDEELAKRCKHYEEMNCRKLGKKEYAELRDQVEFEMLPKSHLRRSIVPVIVQDSRLMIFTSSMKRSDDVLLLLASAALDAAQPFSPGHYEVMTNKSLSGLLCTTARDEVLTDPDDGEVTFQVGDAIVLKKDKQTIRIKDKSVGDHDVQTLLKQEYTVSQLAFDFMVGAEDDECAASFVINDKFVISKISVRGVSTVSRKADADQVALAEQNNRFIVASEMRQVLSTLVKHLDGFRTEVPPKDPLAVPVKQQEQSVEIDEDPL